MRDVLARDCAGERYRLGDLGYQGDFYSFPLLEAETQTVARDNVRHKPFSKLSKFFVWNLNHQAEKTETLNERLIE